ncbi:MAG: hypothetical protein NTZ73_00460 [Candidatus Diapherotrites archaeon]|nr:hypothetical protein [Candidatus Diapherotrites archaeon]
MPPRRPGFFSNLLGIGRRPQARQNRSVQIGRGALRTGWNAAKYVGRYPQRQLNSRHIRGEIEMRQTEQAERRNIAGRQLRQEAEQRGWRSTLTEREEDIESERLGRAAEERRAEAMARAVKEDPVLRKKVTVLATKILVYEVDKNPDLRKMMVRVRRGVANQQEVKYYYELVDKATKEAMRRLGKPVEMEGE